MAKIKIEESLRKIDELIVKLESEDTELEDQIKDYEKGIKLIKECREYLENAEQKITEIGEG